MDEFTLPPSTYESPSRLARRHKLNTIIEDRRGESREERYEDEEQDMERSRGGQYLTPRSVGTASPVPSLTSSISSYYHSRRSGDFDSLYEISDDDSDISPSIMTDAASARSVSPSPPSSDMEKLKRCPSLGVVIPSPSFWPAVPKSQQQQASPPRPPKIPLSPAALSMLGHDLPRLSNPPSLAGSLSTDPQDASSGVVTPELRSHPRCGEMWGQGEKKDQTADMRKKANRPKITICTGGSPQWHYGSAITPDDQVGIRDFASQDLDDSPVIGSVDEDASTGVELPFDALLTLQNLSLEVPSTPEQSSQRQPPPEMQECQYPERSPSPDDTPASQVSAYSLSGMSIPSPSEFFATLGTNARHTWHIGSAPASALPPSSTTAENFYGCPWNKDSSDPVEHLVELDGHGSDTDGPPTARQVQPFSADSYQTAFYRPDDQADTSSPIIDQDEDYYHAIQETAEKSLDRTSMWLAQQTSYLSALRETNPVNDISAATERKIKRSSSHIRKDSLGSPIRKAVHFLETETAKHEYQNALPALPGEPIYYHAFQHMRSNSHKADAFRHRLTRSDSIQSVRLCLPHEHIKRLQGEYHIDQAARPHPQRPISMFPDKEPSTPAETSEQKVIARVERERLALDQINARSWIIEASRFLSGGSLLSSPARQKTIRTPKLGDIATNGRVRNPGRILDLGGLPNGDWAWHCAREFPYSKVYTATTEAHLLSQNICGPSNHRAIAVTKLHQLPYPANHFHAISARSLHTHLKATETEDEYDATLTECLRVLKPGGYLEFSLLDAELLSPGPLGHAASVEFAFNLRTRGYDPAPTKAFLPRLRKAGFDDIKRAWTVLPMGTAGRDAAGAVLPHTPPPRESTFEEHNLKGGVQVEAVQGPVGSTADVGGISGLVGGWGWEMWMCRLQAEMGGDVCGGKGVLGQVAGVLEEGRGCGAGWRELRGWGRKPVDML